MCNTTKLFKTFHATAVTLVMVVLFSASASGKTITLSPDPLVVPEFGSSLLTLTLDEISLSLLNVTLVNSDPSIFDVPIAVSIPSGILDYSILVTNLNPGMSTITASASGWVGDMATLTTNPVPVPAALWLFGSGLLGLVGIARREAV